MHTLLLSLPKTTFLQVTTARYLTTQIARLPYNVRVQMLLPTLESRPRLMRRGGLVLHTHTKSPSLQDLSQLFIPVVYYSCISFIHHIRVFHLSRSFRRIRVFHRSRSFVTLGFSISLFLRQIRVLHLSRSSVPLGFPAFSSIRRIRVFHLSRSSVTVGFSLSLSLFCRARERRGRQATNKNRIMLFSEILSFVFQVDLFFSVLRLISEKLISCL